MPPLTAFSDDEDEEEEEREDDEMPPLVDTDFDEDEDEGMGQFTCEADPAGNSLRNHYIRRAYPIRDVDLHGLWCQRLLLSQP